VLTDDTRFDSFFAWLQAFDPSLLTNEAEVESKFIVPLFQHLGYPEKCRRPQYPLKTYEPGKRGKKGRKPSIDQIYFSTGEPQKQTADTSLLIVEAKEPGETHLDEAMDQARFYSHHLNPLFLVVTNARRLLVVKRHGYRGEEHILDVTIRRLQEQATAHRLYHELRFEVVRRLKEQLADDLTHTLYVDLMHALDRHPDLREQLARGDFERSRTQEGRRLTIIEPKVAVVCDLPLAFGDGACRVEFSNLLLRGLTCHLTHRQILESLMTGLNTPPHWGTRRFLRKTAGSFEAQLGQTTVILSEQEARELCACVDEVCHAYRAILVNTEDTLQTWDYLPVSLPGFSLHMYEILTVEPWLWSLMLQFAQEFDIFEGTSRWHIFDAGTNRLRVLHDKKVENVLLYPSYGPSNLPKSTVDLLYCMQEDQLLTLEEEWSKLSWRQVVGPKGRWTARYTERWLVNKFIPQVLTHYAKQQPEDTGQLPYWTLHSLSKRRVPPAGASAPKHLAPYLHIIQGTFHIYGDCQIPASLLRHYYSALTALVQYLDPSKLAPGYSRYIHGNVSNATWLVNSEQFPVPEEEEAFASEESGDTPLDEEEEISPVLVVKEIIDNLSEHVRRIHLVEHESPQVADYLSRAFIALLEHGAIHCGQEHLNAAREAILPLLDLSRFEERYVLLPPWE
jgi:hypothetical protein